MAAGLTVGPFSALAARAAGATPGSASGATRAPSPDYGPRYPTRDQTTGEDLLLLRGFEYQSYGWRGSPLRDGTPTPGAHDGMAAFRLGDRVHLVRNHEQGSASAPFTAIAYDLKANGGTTNLVFQVPTQSPGGGRTGRWPMRRSRAPTSAVGRRLRHCETAGPSGLEGGPPVLPAKGEQPGK